MRCPRCFRRYQDDSRFCQFDGQRLIEFVDLDRLRSEPTERAGWVAAERYRVHGFIGRGSMAEVFLARDLVTGEPVAIKLLGARHLKDPRTRARLLLEAKACARIAHPNVIDMLDVGIADKQPFIVMEYLFGESLGEYLRREDIVKVDLGIPIVRQVAAGLGAAHHVGVVHRDVKADNVFLVGVKRAPYAAKVVDFGFAKDPEHSNFTQMGVTVGTFEYMAPEQTVGDPPDARTDVYALGVLMYRMFSGRLPFRDQLVPDLLARQLASAPHPPYFGKGPLERGLVAIVTKALRKHRDNRYPSMDLLIEDLDALGSWRGPVHANQPITEPDAYVAETPFSTRAAEVLRRRATMLPSR
jgi:serine/threonine-protein kinase